MSNALSGVVLQTALGSHSVSVWADAQRLSAGEELTMSAWQVHDLSGVPCSPFAQARIEDITNTVTQEIEG
jgi:hypothetical protein